MILSVDKRLNIQLYDHAVKLKEMWYASAFVNSVRRLLQPTMIRLKCLFGATGTTPVQLHLGCGERRITGFVNIDWRKTHATDLVCDIRKLPYPAHSVELIETYHVIEHMPRHDAPKALREWNRVLSPGGMLVIECPDFDAVVKEYVEGNEKRIDNIFGHQRFSGDVHMFGYNFSRLEKLLSESGFINIKRFDPTDYHRNEEPCMRIEATKGNKA